MSKELRIHTEQTSICQIHKIYSIFECQNPALPGDLDGLCLLHSRNERKDRHGAFSASVHEKLERQDYDFRGVFFPDRIDFIEHEFQKDADFSAAIFAGRAFFSRAIFFENAHFPGTTFSGEAYFYRTIFYKEADFSQATFPGQTIFASINPPVEGKGQTLFNGFFLSLRLPNLAGLQFQDMSLAQVLFIDTDLRRIEFHHVNWHPYRGRQAIYDEVSLREEEKENHWFRTWLLYDEPHTDPPSIWTDKYGEVEHLYRYLQENYEKARDYKKMGDFHYGEMEMHRRASKWRWCPLYWYSLYWFFSGYGERPFRALGCLVGFLALFPLAIWFFGLEISAQGQAPGFWESFSFMFEKAALQRPAPPPGLNLLGRFISNFGLLLIPGQAALFLLALRNRLGRRR